MRWFWIDRFTAFESGKRAVAVKNVTLAEEHLHDHFPGFAIMPASLIIEGMAQTAGILVGEAREFRERVILAKIRQASFEDFAIPGDQLHYEATLESIEDSGATTHGVVTKNGKPIGRVDLMFSHVGASGLRGDVPDHNFVFTDAFKDILATYRLGAESAEAK